MLSKTSSQLINAFIELAKLPTGQCEGTARIAKRINAPKNYLGKMLQSLSSQGLVVSQKGLGGGFRLGKKPEKIMLYDIVEPIDKVSLWEECALGMKRCSDDQPCVVHHKWKKVREVYYDFLKKTAVSDLI